jgi:hypothetical protein
MSDACSSSLVARSTKPLSLLLTLFAVTGCLDFNLDQEPASDAGTTIAQDAGWDAGTCTEASCDDQNPCTTDTCTESGCKHAPLTGDSCDDGNACTQLDLCEDGLCVGSSPVTCPAPGVCEDQGECDPETGQCSTPLSTPGTTCDDGDLGTYDDNCSAEGTCGGLEVVCPESTPCVTYTPNGSGTCTATLHNGATCDDGNACTQVDTCDEGLCQGAEPVTCAAPGVCEDPGVCDPGTGLCSKPLSPVGTACDDSSLLTYDDRCNALGTCAGLDIVCPQSSQCATYLPNGTSTCAATLLDAVPCSDSNACTQVDTCRQGVCTGESPVTCAAPGVCEEPGVCDPGTGVCSKPKSPQGTACDDSQVSTYDDQCNAQGTCVGTTVVCPQNTDCVTYEADGTSSCKAIFLDGALCDDSDPCTGAGTCSQGTCNLPAPVVCDNGSVCNDGACSCPSGWSGETCTTDVNECSEYVCGGGSTCSNSPGSYSCACLTNYSSPSGANCVSSVAAMELVIFYDESAARNLGPNPEAKIEEIFLRAKTLFDNGITSSPLTLSLSGVVKFSPFPSEVVKRACNTPETDRPNCMGCWSNSTPSDCSSPESTSASEIDTGLLLSTFTTYANTTRRAAVDNFCGGLDLSVLFTGADFAASTVGLAWVQAGCGSYASAIVQTSWTSNDQSRAVTLAHELGHVIGMQHDASGSSTIMAPSASSSLTGFSSASLNAYNNWRTSLGSGSGNCIVDPAYDDWRGRLCGNGKIDPGETCDPGVASDGCCSSTCQLKPGCLCANTEPCCQNGQPKSAGTVCRSAANDCDIADTCDGMSGLCRDDYKSPGAACANDGFCLRQQCASRDLLCSTTNNNQNPSWQGCDISTRCDRVECNQTGSFCANAWLFTAPDGTSCGAGNQCVGGTCTPSSTLHDYVWTPGSWSACANGVSTRAVSCVDETGALVASTYCGTSGKPATSRMCP